MSSTFNPLLFDSLLEDQSLESLDQGNSAGKSGAGCTE